MKLCTSDFAASTDRDLVIRRSCRRGSTAYGGDVIDHGQMTLYDDAEVAGWVDNLDWWRQDRHVTDSDPVDLIFRAQPHDLSLGGIQTNRLALSQAAKSSIQRASRSTEVGASLTVDERYTWHSSAYWLLMHGKTVQCDDSANIGSVMTKSVWKSWEGGDDVDNVQVG